MLGLPGRSWWGSSDWVATGSRRDAVTGDVCCLCACASVCCKLCCVLRDKRVCVCVCVCVFVPCGVHVAFYLGTERPFVSKLSTPVLSAESQALL